MATTDFVELLLTCGSWQEAQAIADSLLRKKLVACVEFMEISSKSWWQGQLEDSKEVKLIMCSADHLFDKIEAEVKALHSYETFVLQALPVSYVSKEAQAWMREEIKG